MKKIYLLLSVPFLLITLPACSDKSEQSTPQSNAASIVKDIVTIDMVATSSIDTEVPVAQLTFVPNSVAPWLGRIILLDETGHLYSTDINGHTPKPVGTGTYIDIFGLARDKAAGVFLAITKDNKIQAFIESDDDGNFSPMIYSGEDIDAKGFCLALSPSDKHAKVLTNKSKYQYLDLTINGNALSQTKSKTSKAPKNTVDCAMESTLGNTNWFSQTVKKGQKKTHRGAARLQVNEIVQYFAQPYAAQGLYLSSPQDNNPFNIIIKNGLSIRGLNHVKYITSTKSNYGAGGYNTGVLALVDADANRIVFISLSYAERQLMKAMNPPKEEPDDAPKDTP